MTSTQKEIHQLNKENLMIHDKLKDLIKSEPIFDIQIISVSNFAKEHDEFEKFFDATKEKLNLDDLKLEDFQDLMYSVDNRMNMQGQIINSIKTESKNLKNQLQILTGLLDKTTKVMDIMKQIESLKGI